MFKQKNKYKNEAEKTLLLNSIEELLKENSKTIADDVANKLTNVIMIKANDTPSHAPSPIQLTPREKVVIQLVVQGKSNKEIAAEIYLSEGGVRNIITKLLGRFGLNDRTQLAVFAVLNNLVSKKELSIYKTENQK